MNTLNFLSHSLLTQKCHITGSFFYSLHNISFKSSSTYKVHRFLYNKNLLVECMATHASPVAPLLQTWKSLCPSPLFVVQKCDCHSGWDLVNKCRSVMHVHVQHGFSCCTDSMKLNNVVLQQDNYSLKSMSFGFHTEPSFADEFWYFLNTTAKKNITECYSIFMYVSGVVIFPLLLWHHVAPCHHAAAYKWPHSMPRKKTQMLFWYRCEHYVMERVLWYLGVPF